MKKLHLAACGAQSLSTFGEALYNGGYAKIEGACTDRQKHLQVLFWRRLSLAF